MKKFLQLFVMFLLFAGTTALAANKFAVATGNWGATSTWSTTRGGAPGAALPAATDTVIIPSPYMVTVDASGKVCYNLIVEQGAALIGNALNPTSNQVYVRVSGDSVVNNGTMGYDPALGPTSATVLCFEIMTAGKTTVFKGTGSSYISRMRNGSGINNTTFEIAQNMTLTYTGGTGTGGDGWYGNNNNNASGTTLKIDAGDTLTCVDQCNLGTNSSSSNDGPTTTIQVDGALIMKGANSTLHLRPAAGAVVSLIVNGLVDIGHNLTTVGTSGTTATITVNAGGVLKTGTTSTGTINFDNAAQTVTGAGTFQLAGGKMTIGAPAGLDPTNGPIRTTTRTFATTASYSYLSNAAQVTGADLPATVGSLSVADTNTTLTLTNNLSVDTSLTLNYGVVALGGKTLTVKGAAVSTNSKSFVDGSVIIPVSAAGAKTWTVGQDTVSLPMSAYFSAVTGSGNVTVSAVNRTLTAPSNSLAFMNKVLNRYYHVVKGAAITAFKADSLVLTYSPADVAGQNVSEDSLRVFISTSAGWAPVAVARRDTAANTIVTASVTSLGDIIIAGANVTVPVFSVGTGNVPNETGHFASVKAAFDSLSHGLPVVSDMTFYITSDITEPETGGKGIGLAVDPSPFTVTIKPYTGVQPTISLQYPSDGNSGPSGAFIIGMNSAAMAWADLKPTRNIVIDGSNTVGGKTRDLTIQTTGNQRNAIPMVIAGDVSNLTVKNCNIWYKVVPAASTSGNLLVNAVLIRTATTANTGSVEKVPTKITLDNNSISTNFTGATASVGGIAGYASAAPTTYPSGIVISNNKIEGIRRGIGLYLLGNTDIFNNEIIVNQGVADALTSEGIYAATTLASSTYNIYNNKITKLSTISSSGVTTGIAGISIESHGTFNIYNNMISGFALKSTNANKSAYLYGIKNADTTAIANIFNNTIQMDTLASIGTGTVNYRGIYIVNGVNTVKNNIIANNEDDFATFNIYRANNGTPATLLGTTTVDYNDYFRLGTTNANTGFYDAANAKTLADWQTASSQDAHSVSGAPQFVSATDLHVNVSAEPASAASNAGTFIASVTTDIDGDLRSSTTPDIGADEFTVGQAVVKAPVLTLTPATLNFKNVVVNTPMKDSVTVKNTGTDSLFVTNAVSSDPAYVVTPTAARLDTGASAKFYVTYTPTTAGMKTAYVVFSSNDSSATDTLRLSGSGLAPITIGDARKDLNNDFVADRSVTKDTVLIYGVINSPNYGTSYPQLANFIQDTTGGLEVYGYTLPEPALVPGDSIYVIGTVAQYKGVVEVTPLALDSAHFGVIKHNAKVTVKHLSLHEFMQNPELYEGQLVELDTLYKASGTWPLAAANGSVYVTNLAKTDTLQLYIDLDTEIDGTTEPAYPINVVGVISQYDGTAPFNGGYEIMPRYVTDITPITVTGVNAESLLPTVYSLSNNYPNPFNPSTQIKFGLPKASMAKLVVYDMLGREVKTLVKSVMNAGYYEVTWDGSNNHGIRVASGMYIYRIEAGSFTDSKKMMLLK